MVIVTFKNAIRIYPSDDRPSADALNPEIADGEFLVLVGPSGCGKSTSLRMLAGLEDANTSRILTGDCGVIDVQPKNHDITMIFQNCAFYPHVTAHDNMGFILKIVDTPKAEIDKRMREVAKILGLTKYLDRKPEALSDGQRQRMAVERATVRKPKAFLTDEPLPSLDAKSRVRTYTQIASLQRSLGVTTIYVTHDQIEALTMGDCTTVLRDGVFQQIGTPHETYDHPASDFVAGFIGSPATNLRQFAVRGSVAIVGAVKIQLFKATLGTVTPEDGGKVTIGFRPEPLNVVSVQDEHSIPMRLSFVEELDSDAYIYGELIGAEESEAKLGSGKDSNQIIVYVPPRTAPEPGETVYVRIRPDQEHTFSTSTGKRLPI